MRELEKNIRSWRQHMLAKGVRTPVPLEELEAHLRDAIEAHVSAGATEEEAFITARQEIGTADVFVKEFKKVTTGVTMKRTGIVVLGVLGVLVGMGFVAPAIAQSKQGALPGAGIALLCLGIALVLGGAAMTVRGLKRRRA